LLCALEHSRESGIGFELQLTVVGSGYVGLVTGACLADVGCAVVCVDSNIEKVNLLQSGVVPFFEPGLTEIVERTVARSRLTFRSDLAPALVGSDAVFLAVGTPPLDDGSADLRQIKDVARAIGESLEHYTVVVIKSTVPVGTSSLVREIIENELRKRNVEIDFDVASNPEFLKEGTAVSDFLKPERIVVGVQSERARAVLAQVYRPFVLNNHPLLFMDVASAEITKYAANAMLAMRISLMNLVARICEEFDADITSVRSGIGSDSRIGPKFLYPGIGYGGSCFPKDVRALIAIGESKGIPMDLMVAVESINSYQKTLALEKLRRIIPNLNGKKVAVWGLSFKPNTDDMREAPSLEIVQGLVAAGATVVAYDPVAAQQAKIYLGDIFRFADDPYDALIDADALILVTEWSEFRNPDLNEMAKRMVGRVVVDGRNVLDAASFRDHGFDYYGIGLQKPASL
jgi:UDPglucose 6-dehydrogenase